MNMEPSEGMHGGVYSILNKAIQVQTNADLIECDLKEMISGERHLIAMAKPYMDTERYADFDLTQRSSVSAINDAGMLFNLMFFLYCAARSMFNFHIHPRSDGPRSYEEQLPDELHRKFAEELQRMPFVRYMDFIVGDTTGDEDSDTVSVPIGAIGVIVYRFPPELRRSVWDNRPIDCKRIEVPEKPTKIEINRYKKKCREDGNADGLENPETEYRRKLIESLMMIMSLPPRDMLTFLVRGGGATCLKYASNAKLDQDHDMKRLFADQGRMEAAIIAYAKIGGERDCDVLDHAAYFSVVSALRIFYRCMEHNCAIFDLQTGKRFRSMEEFLTVLFLDEDTKAPQSDSIRAQHDRWAMIAEELNARMELIEKIKLALDEKAVLESALEFRINLGSTPQLLANARQCASIIRAELNGSWDTTSEGSELHENSLRSQWDKFRHHVDEQLMSVRDGDVPRLWRISKWFLRWQDHNVTAPSGMAAVKHDPFKGCNYIEAMSRAEKHSQNGRAAAFMREPGLFRLHADEMYRNCHNAFNLFAWPFTPLMDDSAQVRSMLRRVFFPSNGFYVFDARCETRVLRASDDLLLILIDIAERSGSQCNAVEAARFIMSTLTSNGIVGERRHILITGSAAAGKEKSDRCVKRYLVETRGAKCEICGIKEWCGKPVSLIMDHINGHGYDNNLTNVRLICGNCDMQLPTFAGRNRGNGRPDRRERYKRGVSFKNLNS
jgi:hypothetical protein